MIQKVGAILPFGCEQVFDLVADIERYPEFLQWWISARICKREANICFVEQVLGFGPIRLRFASQALLHRPQLIDVTSTEPMFRQYSLSWRIVPISSGCRISVGAEFQLQSSLLQHAVDEFLPAAIDDIVAAFEARAHAVYPSPGGK